MAYFFLNISKKKIVIALVCTYYMYKSIFISKCKSLFLKMNYTIVYFANHKKKN